jgi:hypothetical protein
MELSRKSTAFRLIIKVNGRLLDLSFLRHVRYSPLEMRDLDLKVAMLVTKSKYFMHTSPSGDNLFGECCLLPNRRI